MGRATISLLIGGSDLDPQGVTVLLGVEPSRSRRARDPARRRAVGESAWNMGQWHIERQDVSIDDIAKVVEELVEVFQRGHGALHEVGAEHQHITIGLFELRGSGEMFHLEPTLLARLAALGLTLVVDAYGESPCDETGTPVDETGPSK